MSEPPTPTLSVIADSVLDRLILECAAASGFVFDVCSRVITMLPDDVIVPGVLIHNRIVALINDGRLSYANGRLSAGETVEQHRCRTRTHTETLAVAGAEHRRGLL